MQLYSGSPDDNRKMEAVLQHYDMGICISSVVARSFKPFRCFLDNGAYPAFVKGTVWNADSFVAKLRRCVSYGIKLDFTVAPDIVGGGVKSLELSKQWFDFLHEVTPIALAVQDGMEVRHLRYVTDYDILFIGGTAKWKWENVERFCDYAHSIGKPCHVGRVGTLKNLLMCHSLGVDSVDSSSWIRNKSWHIIDSYYEITGDL